MSESHKPHHLNDPHNSAQNAPRADDQSRAAELDDIASATTAPLRIDDIALATTAPLVAPVEPHSPHSELPNAAQHEAPQSPRVPPSSQPWPGRPLTDVTHILIPRFTPPADIPADIAPASPHAFRAAHGDATVLIVEHEFNNRVLMEKILDLGGYRYVSASNGKEALDVFERSRPDLILTDISMPIMDGLATTAALRARPDGKHVPIIAVSGHALREDREHALRQGCTDYLVKPYKPHELLNMVARLLNV